MKVSVQVQSRLRDSRPVDPRTCLDDSAYRGTVGGCMATTLGSVSIIIIIIIIIIAIIIIIIVIIIIIKGHGRWISSGSIVD